MTFAALTEEVFNKKRLYSNLGYIPRVRFEAGYAPKGGSSPKTSWRGVCFAFLHLGPRMLTFSSTPKIVFLAAISARERANRCYENGPDGLCTGLL